MHESNVQLLYPRGKTLATQQDEELERHLASLLVCQWTSEDFKHAIRQWIASKDWYLDKK